MAVPDAVCWICRKQLADSGEHRLKASDIRARVPSVSQSSPIFLQSNGEATNTRIGSAKSSNLMFEDSICRHCNSARTSDYDEAWRLLSDYLHSNWPDIKQTGQFDASSVFRAECDLQLLRVHLYFVKIFGCKLLEDGIRFDLGSLSAALMDGNAHADIGLNFADSPFVDGEAIAFQSDVNTMGNGRGEVHGLAWVYLVHPVAVKVSYIKPRARLYVPGDSWHPDMKRSVIQLSPYKGGTEPIDGPGAII